jgi:hypothetical protein
MIYRLCYDGSLTLEPGRLDSGVVTVLLGRELRVFAVRDGRIEPATAPNPGEPCDDGAPVLVPPISPPGA